MAAHRVTDVSKLIERVQLVGQRLTAAQPKELSVGNIVRRVLGVIRVEAEEDREGETNGYDLGPKGIPQTLQEGDLNGSPQSISSSNPLYQNTIEDLESSNVRERTSSDIKSTKEPIPGSPLPASHIPQANINNAPTVTSMFSLLSHPVPIAASPMDLSEVQISGQHDMKSPNVIEKPSSSKDLRAEVIEGIEEIIDELHQVDDQIAGYALDHIHANEIILTHTSSATVQKFLLKAATKRKFTVIHAEAYPNDHDATHTTMTSAVTSRTEDDVGSDRFQKSLTAVGITVILIPDAAVFAIMSRVNKVILGTHIVLANGGLVAAAGAKVIAKAASMHRTPVVVLSGIYKLSPLYAFDLDSLIEYGDAGKIFGYEEGDLIEKVDVENPLFDYVPAELVDLYVTNL